MIYNLLLAPWGGFSGEFLVGVCRPVLQILTRFQKKKNVIFNTRFQSDL